MKDRFDELIVAGTVAAEDAVGTISSIDLRHHHADLLEVCRADPQRKTFERVNPIALAREIVQLGTPFAVTEEGDAHPNFKHVLADAKSDEIVDFISVTGLPTRAVKTPWLTRYLRNEERIRAKIGSRKQVCTAGLECLSVCGLRDGIERFGHFCIDT